MTKKEMFTAILALDAVAANSEMVEFINHELDLLTKRSSGERKPTTTQVENEGYKSMIMDYLTSIGTARCIKEIQADIPEMATLSNQRITHLLSALYDKGNGVINKEYVKKTPYYSIKG